MLNKKVDFMNDPGAVSKFCAKNDKVFGCKEAFHCALTCPLAMLIEVQFLVNEKGMTIGEAHRACLRKEIPEPEQYQIIGEAIRASYDGHKRDYPDPARRPEKD